MIPLRALRDLAPLSAASGLVRVADSFYVVADDELHLARFPVDGNAAGEMLRMLPGELPFEPQARKRAKPDFEALTRLPGFGRCAHGALFALGSGSTAQRHRGILLPLVTGAPAMDALRVVDLSAIHAAIEREVGAVNIEGAAVASDRLVLFQRGNKGAGVNATVAFDLDTVCASLERGDSIEADIDAVRRYDLGGIGDVPFSFSDATALDDGSILFAAIAENTIDSYADGAFAGAALGIIEPRGDVRRIVRIDKPAKVEGLHAEVRGNIAQVWLVTDADDASIPAVLYRAELPLDSR
jgi:hypothetical protein